MGHGTLADEKPSPTILSSLGVGVVRRLDPRVRIVGAVVFAVVVVSLKDVAVLMAALAFALGLMVFAKMEPAKTLRKMAAMDGFVVFMLASLPFTVPGEPFYWVFGHPATWEGLIQAVQIALKANAAVLAMMALVGSMESVTFGHALHRLRIPENLVHLLLFTVRYIEVLRVEFDRLRNAMKARGFRPANSRHTYVSYGYLVGMMLVRAMERSERILQAMKCRGFAGQIPLLDEFHLHRKDVVFSLVLAGAVSTLAVWEVVGVHAY